MKIGSKEIKKYILGYNDLEELFNFLEIEFKETIEAIFNALFILLKNYEKNKMQVEYLIYILTEQLETKSLDELKLLTGPIIDFQNKISALKVKERIKIKSPCFRIQNIFNEIQVRLANNLNSQKKECLEFINTLGVNNENLRYRDHDPEELAFYSKATTDIEYLFPFGWGEVWGIADRTDYDLKRHMSYSGESLEYLDPEDNSKYVPYCIEPSVGLDRLTLMVLCDAYDEEVLENGETRVVMHLSPLVAPIKAAILPLSKKLEDKARDIQRILSKYMPVVYDDTGSIGKRYRRQDAVGTPFCITVDFDSLDDNQVTIRERDSMNQIRLPIEKLVEYLGVKIFY